MDFVYHGFKKLGLILSLSFCSYSSAGTLGPTNYANPATWSIIASLGYSNYQQMYYNDGQTPVGRLALHYSMLEVAQANIGLELGVENGNTMRLGLPQATLDELGGLPIQSTMKPMVDVLLTLQSSFAKQINLIGELKGGLVYRHWQFDNRSSIEDVSRLGGEVQAGLGYYITPHTKLSLLYQGLFGGHYQFRVNSLNATAAVSNLPCQHGILLSTTLAL